MIEPQGHKVCRLKQMVFWQDELVMQSSMMRRALVSTVIGSLLLLCASSSWAQTATTYSLPAQPSDVAVSSSGVVVSTLKDTASLWIRWSDNSLRTPAFESDAVDVAITRAGSRAYSISLTSPNFFVMELGSDTASVRSYEANPTTLALTPDESRVVVGLSNSKLVISDTVNFEDLVSITLNGTPRALAVSSNSRFVYVATDSTTACLLKVDVMTGAIVSTANIRGGVSNLAVSASGRTLYAVTSQAVGNGRYRHTLSSIVTNKLTRRSKLVFKTSGSLEASFDLLASRRYLYLAATQPIVADKRTAGLVRFQTTANTLPKPKAFRSTGVGVARVAVNHSGKRLTFFAPDSQLLGYEESVKAIY